MGDSVRTGASRSVTQVLSATSATPGTANSGDTTSFAGGAFTGNELILQHGSGLKTGSEAGGQQETGASRSMTIGPASIKTATVMETAFDTLFN